ncbi:MAG: hypothetical protein WD038_03935 [Balneolales bacterium]
MVVLALTPWFNLSIAGFVVKEAILWWASLVSGIVFLCLFIPLRLGKVLDQMAYEELQHRLKFIQRHIEGSTALISDAWEVKRALDGQGGSFRPSRQQFHNVPVEAVARQSGWSGLEHYVDALREVLRGLPSSHTPGEVTPEPAKQRIWEEAFNLLDVAAQQGALPDARTSRR